MNSHHSHEITLFADALQYETAAERAEFLDRACDNNSALRARIEVLLEAHRASGEFLERGMDDDCALTAENAPQTSHESTGSMVGPYKLLEQIAEGGMGTVWVAEQMRPVRRRVAIKLIKPGMDSKQVLSRFEAERQALALMDHPNIAKVLDGGMTAEGRPFFAMEYVKGVRITDYCDQAKLSLDERLSLFVQVCQAVQHAHQKGIIHRDLKPSNILVCLYDGNAVPKVIDFGLAKAMHQPLTERTLYTAHGLMLGTPLYMSPEQAEFNNLDIDTRTDVYSLGVLLYELITGTTPLERQRFEDAAWQEIVRLIKEEEPSRPSTKLSGSAFLPAIAAQRSLEPAQLRRAVRGELDWIVMKALEKERSRRYETANGLARDIDRYLRDEPVEACPPSTGYRFRKFARRNRAVMLTVSLISVAMLLGTVISTWQAVRATRAEALAEQRLVGETKARTERETALKQATAEAAKAKAISNLLQDAIESANPDAAKGTDYTVRQLLDEIADKLQNRLESEPEAEAALHATIGNAYRRLHQLDVAEPHLQLALDIRKRVLGPEHSEIAASLLDYAWIPFERGQDAQAEQLLRQALQMHATLKLENEETMAIRALLHFALLEQGRHEDAEVVFQQAASVAQRSSTSIGEFANMLTHAAADAVLTGDAVKGERLVRQSLDLHRRTHGESHPEFGWALFELGCALRAQDRFDEAESMFRNALENFRSNFSEDYYGIPRVMNANRHVEEKWIESRIASGQPEAIDEALRRVDRIVAAGSRDAVERYSVALLLRHVAEQLLQSQAYRQQVKKLHQRSFNMLQDLVNDYPDIPSYREQLGHAGRLLGWRLVDNGSFEEARTAFQVAVDAFEELVASNINQRDGFYRHFLASTLVQISTLPCDDDKALEKSCEAMQRSLEIYQSLIEEFPDKTAYRDEFASAQANAAALNARHDHSQEAVE